MTDEEKTTVREVNQRFADLNERLDRRDTYEDERLTKQDVMLAGIITQTTKTNGRVNALEAKNNLLEEKTSVLQEEIKDYTKTKGKISWMIGAGAAGVLLIGVIYALLLKDINKSIQVQIYEAALNQKKTENPSDTSNITNSVTVHN